MLRLEREKVMCRKMVVIEEDLTEEASVEVVVVATGDPAEDLT